MNARAFLFLLSACCSTAASADDLLELQIVTPSGDRLTARQGLDSDFDAFSSGVIAGEEASKEYQAIRCDGPWGATKYHLKLAEGPGYVLRAEGQRLLLQIVEYAVVSADANIEAMSIHCTDMEPVQVARSLVEIELERGSATSDQRQLANGYQLLLRYNPGGAGTEVGRLAQDISTD
ncbi:hypothetical protein [Microbulbifer discodermiae]|uniref:hypothetical protein n=1 Tax=Microbulbifer sp. 2201CG32-9 TaxID=3232309 RepID=UPI00345B8AB5